MKKTILWISLLLLCNNVYADDFNDLLKKQCQYKVFGKGSNLASVDSWILGAVDGILFSTERIDRTERAKNTTTTADLVGLACQEFFIDTGDVMTNESKILWALTKLINKKYEHHLLINKK